MQTPKYFYFRVYDINKGTGIKVEDVSDVDVAEIIRCKDCRWSEIGAWDIRWCIYDKKNRTTDPITISNKYHRLCEIVIAPFFICIDNISVSI